MIEALSLDFDERINGYCVTTRSTYRWFLNMTEGSEENLNKIQRQIIKGSKAYATLRADLKRGCVLPPLVLSAKNLRTHAEMTIPVSPRVWKAEERILADVSDALQCILPENIYIIDGLQRTNALRQIAGELEGAEKEAFLERKIRLEVWLNLPFGAIAYRMLLLNAGQKPMSMKHQVEILSMNLKEDLSDIEGIEIFVGAGRKRARAGQFQLSKLAQAFQAWLQGSPNIDISNAVMQQLLAESAIETLGASLKGDRPQDEKDSFRKFVEWINSADHLVDDLQFFGSDTVLQGLAAVVGSAERNSTLTETVPTTLKKLLTDLEADPSSDPLGIVDFNQIRSGFNPGKRNVGVATRELVFNAYNQYFYTQGAMPMKDCWMFAGALSRA